MPPKVYVPAYPAGDFRAMPALGAGHALAEVGDLLPGNPARGLPTVTGVVLLSDASDGRLVAMLDAAAVTALRTGAAAVLAAETLGRPGTACRDRRRRERAGRRADVRRARPGRAALGRRRRRGRQPQRRSSARGWQGRARRRSPPTGVVTVTPGNEVLFPEGSLRPGQHVSLMGADGPGKAEIAVAEIARSRVFCDDWEQASHGGELAAAVEAGAIARADVTTLGDVLHGDAPRAAARDDDVTLLRLDRPRDPGSRDRARGDGARRRARPADARPLADRRARLP